MCVAVSVSERKIILDGYGMKKRLSIYIPMRVYNCSWFAFEINEMKLKTYEDNIIKTIIVKEKPNGHTINVLRMCIIFYRYIEILIIA